MKLKKYSSFEELKAENNNQSKLTKEEIKKRHDDFQKFIEILRESSDNKKWRDSSVGRA